jgi:membrane-bound lytic murein transglycosylase
MRAGTLQLLLCDAPHPLELAHSTDRLVAAADTGSAIAAANALAHDFSARDFLARERIS